MADHHNSIRLWDSTTARLFREWRRYEVALHLSFSPTGTLLLSENYESGVGRTWKVDDPGNDQTATITRDPGIPAAGP